jgi:hypothetical protein
MVGTAVDVGIGVDVCFEHAAIKTITTTRILMLITVFILLLLYRQNRASPS